MSMSKRCGRVRVVEGREAVLEVVAAVPLQPYSSDRNFLVGSFL